MSGWRVPLEKISNIYLVKLLDGFWPWLSTHALFIVVWLLFKLAPNNPCEWDYGFWWVSYLFFLSILLLNFPEGSFLHQCVCFSFFFWVGDYVLPLFPGATLTCFNSVNFLQMTIAYSAVILVMRWMMMFFLKHFHDFLPLIWPK